MKKIIKAMLILSAIFFGLSKQEDMKASFYKKEKEWRREMMHKDFDRMIKIVNVASEKKGF